ncbi:MAG TPA: hypothetical protein VLB68_23050 [Pyrinomonadaceae bacterium]|nr:hypothetical protein [Pyrinomonadaceae bacterium]
MTRLSSLILAMITFLTLTVSIVQSQKQGADSNRLASRSQRPTVTLIPQQSSSVILKLSPVKPIPENPGLVKITFKAQGPKTVKGFHYHYEENFVDQDGTRGSIVADSTSLRTLGREESLNAHKNAEIELWVSEVEFIDGSRWKSALTPKLNREEE